MAEDISYTVAVLLVELHIPAARSLKDKRSVLKSLKDRSRAKFNVSVCELDSQDKWQRACMAFTSAGNDRRYLNSCMENLLSFMESFQTFDICDHRIEFF